MFNVFTKIKSKLKRIFLMTFTHIAIAVLVSFAIFIFAGAWFLRFYISKKVSTITPAELSSALQSNEDILMIDMRPKKRFNGLLGHIKGALNIPADDLDMVLKGKELADFYDVRIVVIDDTNTFAGLAFYNRLKSTGFNNASLLLGGLGSWIKNRLPTIRGEEGNIE